MRTFPLAPRAAATAVLLAAAGMAALPRQAASAAVRPPAAFAATTTGPTTCASDPLQAKELAALNNFETWLTAAKVGGYIGEVGWPSGADSSSWNALANRWYDAADADQLWVTAWSTGEWWGSYPLQPYVVAPGTKSVDARGSGAAVLAAHPGTATVLRGVNDSGGEFGTGSPFSNSDPGTFHTNYHYDSAATFTYLASQGVKVVRLPFRWERLQPTLNGPLNTAAVADLQAAVTRANQAGIKVILDLHNFGRYVTASGTLTLGSAALPTTDLANFWSRFATAFSTQSGVAGYDLMNEPHDLASVGVWQRASQQAVTAVRATGSKTLILVEGYDWAGTWNWSAVQPTPWIVDPARNFRYEAHQYFDLDWSGQYRDSYATDLAAAGSEGFKSNC
jgi:hypothetical protein